MANAMREWRRSRGTQLGTAACAALFLSLLSGSMAAHAQEPAGAITLSRDLPARNAFRPGPPGTPHDVATAREDVIIASTRALEASVASMPGMTRQDPLHATQGMGLHVAASVSAVTREATTAHFHSGAGSNASNAIQGAVAGAVSGSMGALGNPGSMMGAR